MKMQRTCIVLLWIVSIVGFSTSSVIKMKDGGYTDILVAIHSNVPQDKELLTNLKGLLTNASSFLYDATRGLAYFRGITIVLPENWTHYSTYETVVSNHFEQADIRVDLENEYDGPEPFTRHFRECGEQGEYIQLTPNYLQSLSSQTARNAFGIPERRLVHEWAHFRYGVFDEHPIDGLYPTFYKDKHKIIPNTCSQEISESSYFITNDGKPCDPQDASEKCFLRTLDSSVTSTASLMYSTSINSVTSFCDNSEERKHNRKAITKQNIKCKYKSTWEVISSHEDFRVKRNDSSKPNTTPKFRIIRQSSSAGRCVLVLDISGSMQGRPIELLHEAASRFVADQAPDNITVGVVTFGSEARAISPLTTLNSSTKKSIVNSLPKIANGGGTAIGKGLLKGLQVLEGDKKQPVEGSVILLITDGEETDKPFIESEEVLPKLVEKKVVIKTIAYGDKATEKLTALTKATGGQGYFFKNIDDVKANTESLDAAFMAALTLQSDVAFEPISIASSSLKMYFKENTFSAFIDEGLGRKTVFTITSQDINQIIAELTSPSGRLYTFQSPEYNKEESLKRIMFRFQDSEVGNWRLSVKKLSESLITVSFSAKSEPKTSNSQPVRIKTFLDSSTVKHPPTIKIYAQVTKNNLPVLRARVITTIQTPSERTYTVKLRDNGKGPDSVRSDGLYSGLFTNFDSKGRYSVFAQVTGVAKAARVRTKSKAKKLDGRQKRSVTNQLNATTTTTLEDEDYDDEYEFDDVDGLYEEEPIGAFERTANVGVFSVEEWNPQAGDLIPPIRVSDLQVINVDITKEGSRTATIQWTSPGDDENNGNASFIELRASTDFDELLTTFTSANEINSSLVIDGMLTPEPANEMQTLTLRFPVSFFVVVDANGTSEYSDSIYISLRAGDESGNVGDVSNIVTIYFDEIDDSPSSSNEGRQFEEESIHPGIVILIVVACGAVLLAVLMLCLSQKRKKNYRPVFLMPTPA